MAAGLVSDKMNYILLAPRPNHALPWCVLGLFCTLVSGASPQNEVTEVQARQLAEKFIEVNFGQKAAKHKFSAAYCNSIPSEWGLWFSNGSFFHEGLVMAVYKHTGEVRVLSSPWTN